VPGPDPRGRSYGVTPGARCPVEHSPSTGGLALRGAGSGAGTNLLNRMAGRPRDLEGAPRGPHGPERRVPRAPRPEPTARRNDRGPSEVPPARPARGSGRAPTGPNAREGARAGPSTGTPSRHPPPEGGLRGRLPDRPYGPQGRVLRGQTTARLRGRLPAQPDVCSLKASTTSPTERGAVVNLGRRRGAGSGLAGPTVPPVHSRSPGSPAVGRPRTSDRRHSRTLFSGRVARTVTAPQGPVLLDRSRRTEYGRSLEP